jgi:hypothetical protein
MGGPLQGYVTAEQRAPPPFKPIRPPALTRPPGIGPKVTQSVITAAFLFAFKDALYEHSVKLRRRIPAKLPLPGPK